MCIELSQRQVDGVVHAAADGGCLSLVLSGLAERGQAFVDRLADLDDRRLSRSLLMGLVMLASMPDDGSDVGVAELARLVGMNTSTAHRYLTTLLEVGLVERDAETRRYRIAG